ncbi:MAG: hypothetical protein U0401_20580 [Anaerolineae bacterium]
MPHPGFTSPHRAIGRAAAWVVSGLLVVYLATTALGLLSLKSPQEPIGDPYFTLMELLIVLIAPLLLVSMIAVHAYAPPEAKVYSLTALILMILLAGITSSVHFVILTVSRQLEAAGLAGAPLFFSFTWPSVVYTLDILAWDWFFALAMLCAAPVFKGGRLVNGAAAHVAQLAGWLWRDCRRAAGGYAGTEYRDYRLRGGDARVVFTAWPGFRAHPTGDRGET